MPNVDFIFLNNNMRKITQIPDRIMSFFSFECMQKKYKKERVNINLSISKYGFNSICMTFSSSKNIFMYIEFNDREIFCFLHRSATQ